jgi:hypothetical protein
MIRNRKPSSFRNLQHYLAPDHNRFTYWLGGRITSALDALVNGCIWAIVIVIAVKIFHWKIILQ